MNATPIINKIFDGLYIGNYSSVYVPHPLSRTHKPFPSTLSIISSSLPLHPPSNTSNTSTSTTNTSNYCRSSKEPTI